MFFLFCQLGFGKINNSSNLGEDYELKKLTSLAKVWGFLKYYHPNVASGKFNWDEQFINILTKIEDAKDKTELSKIYLDWINSLGVVKECKSCKKLSDKKYFGKNFDLSWLESNELFTDELSKKLKYIEENRFQGNNHYVNIGSHGNIEIKNELDYENFEYPNKGYRLLSIIKYWNTIEYFFPYKYLTDQKWDEVLSEMIPKFIACENATQYQLCMLETVVKLDDSHANFYSNKIHDFFGRKYIPVYFNVINGEAIVTGFYNDSLAKANDLKIGDVIEKIEDKEVSNLILDRKKYIHGSNNASKAINYDYFIFNGSTDSVNLTINRKNIKITKNVGRYDEKQFGIKKPSASEKYKLINNLIGYVDMASLELKDVEKMMVMMKSTKALVIDLRNYPNFAPWSIARHFIQNEKEFSKIIKPDISYPGKFYWSETNKIEPFKNKYYSGEVVLLVNEQTQSKAEYAAMLFQSGDKVTTIGSTTSGADGDVSKIEFIKFKTYISGLGVFYPDGNQTQRKGVKIDIEVAPTKQDYLEGKDVVLDKALNHLKNKLKIEL